MAVRKLERAEWAPYFDGISRELPAQQVQIDVTSPDLGAQVATGRAMLHGLVYDPRDDVIEVATDVVDHRIHRPREVHVDETAEGLGSVEVIDGDGRQQIIVLKPLLRLLAPR